MTFFPATQDSLGHYVTQARDTAADIVVRLLRGSEAAGTLADRGTWAAILAASGNLEANFTNYVAKTLATPTRTTDAAEDAVYLGAAARGTELQLRYDMAGGAVNNALVRAVFLFVPTVVAANNLILPLYAPPITATTEGTALVLTVNAQGFARVRVGT